MRKSFEDFTHLAGSSRSGCSLWEGPDHLLIIETMSLLGFREQYKRIDYARIETISYGRTKTFWWTFIWQALLLLPLSAAAFTMYNDNAAGAVVFGVLGFLVAVMLIVNLVRGPTCICRLQTAVQVLRLKPLNRLRATLPVVERLRQLCLQHQGGLAATPEALLSAAAYAASQHLPGAAKPPFAGSRIVTLAMCLLMAGGALTIGEPFVNSFGYFFADMLTGLVAHTLAVIGLAIMLRYQAPGILKFSLWGASANLLVSFITGYALLIMASIREVESAGRRAGEIRFGSGAEFSVWQWMSGATFDDLGWLAWMFVITGSFDVVCGLLGLPSALRLTRAGTASPAAAVPPPVIASSQPPVTDDLP